jgi:PIN domain nuclease of toxin-antitoxin system
MLDSHALLWWLDPEGPMSDDVRSMVDDAFNEVAVSAAAIWELGIKEAKGGIRLPRNLLVQLDVVEVGVLDITPVHGEVAAQLPRHHGDPFDRVMIAQALQEGYAVVTSDRRFADYGVPVLSAR